MALNIVGVDTKKPRVIAMDVLPMDYVSSLNSRCKGASSSRETFLTERIFSSCRKLWAWCRLM